MGKRRYDDSAHTEIASSTLNGGQTFIINCSGDTPHQKQIKQSDFNTEEILLSQNEKNEFFEALMVVAEDVFGRNAIDQGDYLKTVSTTGQLELDGNNFWIFRDLDYLRWCESRDNAGRGLYTKCPERLFTLIFSSPIFSQQVTSHIVEKLKPKTEKGKNILLNFSYSSITVTKLPPSGVSLRCISTILKQLMLYDNAIIKDFTSELVKLVYNNDKDIRKWSKNPNIKMSLELLFAKISTENLWATVGFVLTQVLRHLVRDCGNKQCVTLFFDFSGVEDGFVVLPIIQTIRRARQNLEGICEIKMMITIRRIVSDYLDSDLELGSESWVKYDRERQECLNTLRFHNARYEKILSHHDKTCGWLQDSTQYRNWISSNISSQLLIEGKPGSGKSTLIRYFNDYLLKAERKDPNNIVARFFFSHRDGPHERNQINLFRSLLFDILHADESFFFHFQKNFRDMTCQKTRDWSCEVLKDILFACLSKHPLKRKIYLVVDALDESQIQEREELIDYLWKLSYQSNNGSLVKVFLTSRPITDLQGLDFIHSSKRNRIILQERNCEDIKSYTTEFLEKSSLKDKPVVRHQVFEHIVKHAEGVFLWVQLVTCKLQKLAKKGVSPAKIYDALKSLPTNLRDYYIYMLNELCEGDDDDIRDGKRILKFCLFSHRPISLMEIRDAIATPGSLEETVPELLDWEDQKPMDMRGRLIACMGSFLEVKVGGVSEAKAEETATVQVMHQTVYDFFLDSDMAKKSQFQNSNPKKIHEMLQITCIQYLNIYLDEAQIKGFTDSPIQKDTAKLDFIQHLETRPFMKYSLEYLMFKDKIEKDEVLNLFSELVSRIQHYHHLSFASCLLNRIVSLLTPGSQLDLKTIKKSLQDSLLNAVRNGYAVAAGNLLAAGVDVETKDPDGNSVLQLAALNDHEITAYILIVNGNTKVADPETFHKAALHCAAMKGHNDTARVIVFIGKTDPDEKDELERTALHIASKNNHTTTARILIVECGADTEARDSQGETALHIAAKNGYTETARMLIVECGADTEARDMQGETALHIASKNNHTATARMLIVECGADIEARDIQGETALHIAAKNGYTETARMLIVECGADTEARDRQGETALHIAAKNGYTETARMLIVECEADIEARDMQGETVLHIAAKNGHKAIVHMLILEYGADKEARDNNRRTALHIATWYGRIAIARMLVLKFGADTEARDKQGETALHFAVRWDRKGTAHMLIIECGADKEARDYNGWTALHYAVQAGYEETARMLIFEAEVDVESKQNLGNSALHIAADFDRGEIVQVLVNEFKANVEATNNKGQTALYTAIRKCHVDTATVLVKQCKAQIGQGIIDLKLNDPSSREATLIQELLGIESALSATPPGLDTLSSSRALPPC